MRTSRPPSSKEPAWPIRHRIQVLREHLRHVGGHAAYRLLAVAEVHRAQIGGRSQTDGFESASRTEDCDGMSASSVLVDETPVSSVTSVAILGSDGSTSTLPTSSYTVDLNQGIIYMVGAGSGPIFNSLPVSSVGFGPTNSFPSGRRNVRVVYTGGYDPIPGAQARRVDGDGLAAGQRRQQSGDAIRVNRRRVFVQPDAEKTRRGRSHRSQIVYQF